MLNLLLVDAELELVPPDITSHPAVKASARRRNKEASTLLLDSNLHHSALRGLPLADRRGRPDLVHLFLLIALDSIANHRGMLRCFVHTRNDELITVDPSTRLPKNYPRFVGLMESLIEKGAVPSHEDPLLEIHRLHNFERCMEAIPHGRTVVLSNKGKPIDLSSYFSREEDLLCLIGGFSKGEFTSDVLSRADEVVSIHEGSLPVWTVASELLVNYGNAIR